jgi:hypothetical protein
VVTDPEQVKLIAAAFDRLRVAAMAGPHECGLVNVRVPGLGYYGRGTMIMRVAFSRDRRSSPNLVVWTPTCSGIGVRANGRLLPALAGDQQFRSTVRRVMLAGS